MYKMRLTLDNIVLIFSIIYNEAGLLFIGLGKYYQISNK